MTDHAELIERLRKDADFIDADTYDECWEVKETDRGKRLREAATALDALVAERDALREAMRRVHAELDEYIDQNNGEVMVSIALAFEVARAALAQGGGQ